ncbi:porin family protein [uncultured Winogradskyella sp.]|uniref:porin family protein n=1 Tax=uncultured Winogradskyella sp. TaxID=395353 RepID=UPI0026399761|nr:porin family protein [uncultured Winogradskyella sp.]
MNSKNNIGTQIKSRLKHLSASPDDSVWENIEKELKKKRRKRILFFWWLSSGSLLTIALVTAIFYGYTTSKNPLQEKTNEINKSTTKKTTNENADYNKPSEKTLTSGISKEPQKPSASKKTYLLESLNNKNNSSKGTNNLVSKKNTFKNLDEINNSSSSVDNTLTLQDIKTDEEEELKHTVAEVKVKEDIKKPEELKEKQKDSTKSQDYSRWSFTPQGLLSYYGTFKSNASNNTNYNYGFLASYKMNSQFYARTGIRLLNLSQDINGLTREVTYYQFPLEIKYTPFQYKINPYAIGGFSYYSLRDSKTNSNTLDFQATVGLNAGLGAEIKLWKKTFINFESIFNYQLMPFSNKNDVKPYILNLSLGIEYRF